MNRTLLIGLLVVGFLVAAGSIIAFVPLRTIDVTSTASHDFTINKPMVDVRKILVRSNAVKRIVAMADAKLVDQRWLGMHFQLQHPILDPDFDLKGNGQLVVETNNRYLGKYQITLDQNINITRYNLSVVSNLDQPVGPIRKYYSTLTLVPDEQGKARFESTLELEIKTTASWLISPFVKAGIRAAARDSLRNQEKALREVVASGSGTILDGILGHGS